MRTVLNQSEILQFDHLLLKLYTKQSQTSKSFKNKLFGFANLSLKKEVFKIHI